MDISTYSKYSQLYTEEVPPILSKLLEEADWASLMDMGCGDGALLDALNKKRIFQGKSVYAVELSPERLDLVRKIDEKFTCLLSDAGDIPIDDCSIDFLVSTQVIEHVEDDGQMAREIYRILSPGGTVYLSTIFKKWYGWYFYRCNGKWTIDPTHLREYGKDSQLLPLFETAGLQVLGSWKTLDGRAVVDSVLRRLGAKRDVYSNGLLRALRKIRVPIPGYYIWEIVCRKP
jgi:2-polyprenyl-3-methyl-5-hydroxy-6-metoxy-1,4-benzoquinol methylase